MGRFCHKNKSILGTILAALSCFALSTSGAFASAAFDAGVQAFNQKDYRTAYGYFELALKSSPKDLNTLYYDALSLHQLNLSAAAIKRYEQIIEIDPQSQAAALAQGALKTLRGGAVGAAKTGAASASRTAAVTAAAVPAKEDDDMAGLPDQANFYFTKEPNGHMAVDIMVNHHPVKAWFDTGADAFFYKDQLRQCGVDCNKAVAAGYTAGWAGKKVAVSQMPAEVTLGNLTRKIDITMEDSASGLEKNLIGQSILRGYQYEIDDNGGRVFLKKISGSTDKIDPLYDIPCTLEEGRDIVPLTVNGKKVDVFIDTGSAFTIFDKRTADRLGIESTSTQQMVGVGGDLTVGVGTAYIKFGPIAKDFAVRIGGSAGSCIGQDFMQGWRFKIDRERKLLRFFH